MSEKLRKIKGFMPYIMVVFLNAIIDLGDKILLQNAIFKFYDGSTQIILTAFVNALIILPAIMLFTPAGYISDKLSKTIVVQKASKVALFLTILIMISYYFGLFKIALFVTFLLAAQSAFFFPAKYGLIKEIFGKNRLPEGNGIIQATTIIAILLSSVVFSIAFESMIDGNEKSISDYLEHVWIVTIVLVIFAVIQVILTKKIPIIEKGDNSLQFDMAKYKSFAYLKENLKHTFGNRVIAESIIGLGLFYGISQVLLAIFGVHLEEMSNEHNTVVAQGIMAMAGVGVAIGALVTAKISKNYIETGLIPVGIFGIVISIMFITNTTSIYLLGVEFLMFGIFGGFILVVLNSLIQFRSDQHELGRVMAANNWVQNIFMLSFLLLTMLWALNDFETKSIFTFLSTVGIITFIYTMITLPQFLLRFIFKFIASFRYKLSTYGVNNFPKDGAALLLGNHVSWIDWMILSIVAPRRVSFVIERSLYEKWYLKPVFKFFGLIPISTRASKSAFTAIKKKLNDGKIVAIFPEGYISRNGHLGKFQKGFELIIKNIDVPIIPFYIQGLWGSRFSYAEKKLKDNVRKVPRDISVSFGKALDRSTTAQSLKKAVFELQIKAWSLYTDRLQPIQNAWLKMAKSQGEKLSVADGTGAELSNHKLAAVVFTFAKVVKQLTKDEQNIAIVMPASVGGTIMNLSVLTLGKTIVNLNYTSNKQALESSIKAANIKTIFTSKQFLKKLKDKGMDIEESLKNANLIFLEDLKESDIKKSKVLLNWALVKILPYFILKSIFLKSNSMDDVAGIIFSSGSEGTPKGIMLTHKNFMGNIKQFCTMLNLKENDVIMATLPTFHVFGLTVSTLAPLVEGVPFICQPDPTDAQAVGKLAAKYRGTLLFGTSTFFRIYTKNKKLQPLMFESIRYVVGGAEKVSIDVREGFKKKFGLDIHEAYGATEATPGISANIPDSLNTKFWTLQIGHKIGTVGMPFPGSTVRIVDPDSYEELAVGDAGMIIVGGTQIMKGYLNDPKKTKEVIIQKDGIRWYITGDKGKLDSDGFITIVDRYSRFVKLGGEMISLGAVEEKIRDILPEEVDIVAAAAKDSKKGEKIILFFNEEIDEEVLRKTINLSDLHPLMIPTIYKQLKEMPKLGSGKTDLKLAKKIASEFDD